MGRRLRPPEEHLVLLNGVSRLCRRMETTVRIRERKPMVSAEAGCADRNGEQSGDFSGRGQVESSSLGKNTESGHVAGRHSSVPGEHTHLVVKGLPWADDKGNIPAGRIHVKCLKTGCPRHHQRRQAA